MGGEAEDADKQHEDVILGGTLGSFLPKIHAVTPLGKLSGFQPLNVKCCWHVWQ